jgi:hypothetical protein
MVAMRSVIVSSRSHATAYYLVVSRESPGVKYL